MACCLTAPSHYLNQCWLAISKVLWHSSEGNFVRDTSATIHNNLLENYQPKFKSKSPRGQWVNVWLSLLDSSHSRLWSWYTVPGPTVWVSSLMASTCYLTARPSSWGSTLPSCHGGKPHGSSHMGESRTRLLYSESLVQDCGDSSALASINCPDSKVHGANMGPIWGRQDPGGPHVGPMNFAIWVGHNWLS